MKNRKDKYEFIVDLYEMGNSLQMCADIYGVSKQAIHASLKARGVIIFRKNSGQNNAWYRGGKKHPLKDMANSRVARAVRSERLIPKPCEICGTSGYNKIGRNKIQAHHDDYRNVLSVRWLCRKHHYAWHKTNKPLPLLEEQIHATN